MATYDFSGWATRNDLKCADGRIIRDGAFKECDGRVVPLVWQHQHDSPENVLGHALLEYRPGEGMYAYGKFNDTPDGIRSKSLVEHGDISNLSIYANGLKQHGADVTHGVIREVSLVLAGANPGAMIENIFLAHGAEGEDEEGVIYTDEPISLDPADLELRHAADKEGEEPKMAEEQKSGGKTVGDVYNSFTDEQKKVVQFMIAQALASAKGKDDEDDEEEDDAPMKHNAFYDDDQNALQHGLSEEDVKAIFADAKRMGSLRDSVRAHAESGVLAHAVYNNDGTEQTYGIADIDMLFPDYKTLNGGAPEFIQRDMDWVGVVMNGVRHSPFSRVKSVFANITMDEARARGYLKGRRKKEEVFTLLKRSTDPQTIYKKQKMDRDDVIDITDFDVVAWIRKEMRMMLDEEIARAILIGDGRLTSDDDHISEDHIRSIWHEDELYAYKVPVVAGADAQATAKNAIRAIIKARKDYKGSGNLTFFTTEDWLTEMLLIEDGFGHALYADEAALARKLRVNRIVTVPLMENQVEDGATLVGIVVDLKDYNVGADKGGQINTFEDFDIDYNQQKYLIETRISGALVKPYSAMIVELNGKKPTYTEAEPAEGDNPKANGWYEKEGDIYVRTDDTTVNDAKTYYVRSMA